MSGGGAGWGRRVARCGRCIAASREGGVTGVGVRVGRGATGTRAEAAGGGRGDRGRGRQHRLRSVAVDSCHSISDRSWMPLQCGDAASPVQALSLPLGQPHWDRPGGSPCGLPSLRNAESDFSIPSPRQRGGLRSGSPHLSSPTGQHGGRSAGSATSPLILGVPTGTSP